MRKHFCFFVVVQTGIGRESMASLTSGEWFSKADYTNFQSRRLLLPSSASPSQLSLDSLQDDSVRLCLYMQCSFQSSDWTSLKNQQFVDSREILRSCSLVRSAWLHYCLCHCGSLFWRWSTCSRMLSVSLGQQCFGCRRNGRWCLQDVWRPFWNFIFVSQQVLSQ